VTAKGVCDFMRDRGAQFSHRADPAHMGRVRPEPFSIFATLTFNIIRQRYLQTS
jgi:hypothetical protein